MPWEKSDLIKLKGREKISKKLSKKQKYTFPFRIVRSVDGCGKIAKIPNTTPKMAKIGCGKLAFKKYTIPRYDIK